MNFVKSLYMNEHQIKFADSGLKHGALKFGSFTLKSKRNSTYFWNAGNGYSTGEGLYVVAGAHARQIGEAMKEGTEINILHGPAMKAVPIVPVTADKMYKDDGTNVRFCHDVLETIATPAEALKQLRNINIEIIDEMVVPDFEYTGKGAREFSEEFAEKLRGIDATFVLAEPHAGIVAAALMVKEAYEHGLNLRWGYTRPVPKLEKGDPREAYLVGKMEEGDRVLVIRGENEPSPPIAGDLREGDHVAMVDDVTTDGGTKITGWETLTGYRDGLTCAGVYIQLDRQEMVKGTDQTARQRLKENGMELNAILEAREMIAHYHRTGVISDEQLLDFVQQQADFGAKSPPKEESKE